MILLKIITSAFRIKYIVTPKRKIYPNLKEKALAKKETKNTKTEKPDTNTTYLEEAEEFMRQAEEDFDEGRITEEEFEARERYYEELYASGGNIEKSSEGFSTEGGAPKFVRKIGEKLGFSVSEINNQKVVIINQTDIDTLLKSEGDFLPAKVRKYLNKKFKNTVLPVGKTDKAYIRREGTNEYTNPAKHLDEETYLSKMHAASDFQELLSASTFVEHVADDGRHPDAVRGWNYYKTYFLVPDSGGVYQAFEGIVKIKLIARGDCFYDITKIKNITDSTAGQAFLEAAGSVDNVSNNSVPYSVSKSRAKMNL